MSKVITQLRDAPGVTRGNTYRIETEKFEVEENHNPRNYDLPENRAHLDRLKLSIRKHGVETPVKVRFSGGKIILVDGECRWRSCMEILAEDPDNEFARSIPATKEDGNEIERLRVALTANDGKPLSEWELGNAYKRFLKMGKDENWVAEELGVTVKNVKMCIDLSNSSLAVQEMLSSLAVSPAAAVHAVRTHGDNASFVLKKRVEEAREEAAKKPAGKKGPTAPAPVKREKASNTVHIPKKDVNTLLKLFSALMELDIPHEATEMCETGTGMLEKLLPSKAE